MSKWLDELDELFGEECGQSTPPPVVKKQWHMADPNQPAFLQRCPTCDGPMTDRNGKNGQFLGCKAYPRCKGTRSYPAT